jgi:hypothetical protein
LSRPRHRQRCLLGKRGRMEDGVEVGDTEVAAEVAAAEAVEAGVVAVVEIGVEAADIEVAEAAVDIGAEVAAGIEEEEAEFKTLVGEQEEAAEVKEVAVVEGHTDAVGVTVDHCFIVIGKKKL